MQRVSPKVLYGLVLALALAFISPWEWHGTETTGYADIIGVATACMGHTGEGVEVGKTYTPEQCRKWAESDVGIAVRGVDACITVPMRTYEWAAFSSLAFNIGVNAFCHSSIARKANAGDMEGACNAIMLYDMAGGRHVLGLTRRRAAERALCMGEV